MKYFKTLLFFLAGILLCACNANEDEKVLNSEERFTEADIIKLKTAKNLLKETADEIAIPMQQAIRRSRATTGEEELTDNEAAELRSRLKIAGTQAVASFNDFGIPSSELNGIIPISGNEELYGMIGINIFNGLDPIDRYGSNMVMFDYEKALGCLAGAFGITPAQVSVIAGFSLIGAAKTISKEMLKKIITATVKEIAKKLGRTIVSSAISGGTAGVALIVLEWSWCYFDIPSWC